MGIGPVGVEGKESGVDELTVLCEQALFSVVLLRLGV